MEEGTILLETISDTQGSTMDAEKIISTAVDENGKRFYHVRWITYSWEPETSFESAEHMVKEFWEEYGRLQKENQKEQAKQEEAAKLTKLKQKTQNKLSQPLEQPPQQRQQKQQQQQQQQKQQRQLQLQQQQQQQQQQQHQQQQQQQQQQKQRQLQLQQQQQQKQQQQQHQQQQQQQQQQKTQQQPQQPLKLPIRDIKFKSSKTEEFVQAIEQTIEYVVHSFKENQKRLEDLTSSDLFGNVTEKPEDATASDDDDTLNETTEYMSEEECDVMQFDDGGITTDADPDADIADPGQDNLIKGKEGAIIVNDREEAIRIQEELMKPHKFHMNSPFGYPSDGFPDLRKKKVMWQNRYIAYSGIPFVCLGRRWSRCAYGGIKIVRDGKYIRDFPCRARSQLQEYLFFPQLKIPLEWPDWRKRTIRSLLHDKLGAGDLTGTLRRAVLIHPQPSDHIHNFEVPIRARCSNITWRKGVPGHTYDYRCKACFEQRKVDGWKPRPKKKKKKKLEES